MSFPGFFLALHFRHRARTPPQEFPSWPQERRTRRVSKMLRAGGVRNWTTLGLGNGSKDRIVCHLFLNGSHGADKLPS